MTLIKDTINHFIFHCTYEKNLSSKTIKAYTIDLTQFLSFKKFNLLHIQDINKYHLKEYLQYLYERQLKEKSIKRRSIDNIAIERFFRTFKYENIYISDYQSIKELKTGILNYIYFYNHNRFHSTLNYQKSMNVYKKSDF